jgi:hypothetical protein
MITACLGLVFADWTTFFIFGNFLHHHMIVRSVCIMQNAGWSIGFHTGSWNMTSKALCLLDFLFFSIFWVGIVIRTFSIGMQSCLTLVGKNECCESLSASFFRRRVFYLTRFDTIHMPRPGCLASPELKAIPQFPRSSLELIRFVPTEINPQWSPYTVQSLRTIFVNQSS